jgi:hypothetical protein
MFSSGDVLGVLNNNWHFLQRRREVTKYFFATIVESIPEQEGHEKSLSNIDFFKETPK